jgi:hypothetical protein
MERIELAKINHGEATMERERTPERRSRQR